MSFVSAMSPALQEASPPQLTLWGWGHCLPLDDTLTDVCSVCYTHRL